MSDPNLHIRAAQAIDFGLLAARSSDAISKAGHQELTAEDRTVLEAAADFLHDAAQGAEFVTTGNLPAGSAFSSTEVLGYALQPVETIDKLLHGRDVPAVFVELEGAVREIAAGRTTNVAGPTLSDLRMFFDRLYTSLLGSIEHNRNRSSLSDPGTRLGYAF